jgi:hypothetical protein
MGLSPSVQAAPAVLSILRETGGKWSQETKRMSEPKRRAANIANGKSGPGPTRAKPKRVARRLQLSALASKRLDAHSAGTGQKPSRIIDELILHNLRRFVVHDLGERGLAISPAGDERAA